MPCWEFPPLITGGLGVACEGLAGALSGEVDLKVVTPSDPGAGAYESGYGGDLKERVHHFTRQVVRECPEDVDLVHAHDWMSFPAAMELKSGKGIPMLAHVHSLECDRVGENAQPWISGIEREGLRQAERGAGGQQLHRPGGGGSPWCRSGEDTGGSQRCAFGETVAIEVVRGVGGVSRSADPSESPGVVC